MLNYLVVFISISGTILGTGDTEVDEIPYHYLLGKTDNIQMNINMFLDVCVSLRVSHISKYINIINVSS